MANTFAPVVVRLTVPREPVMRGSTLIVSDAALSAMRAAESLDSRML